MIGPLAALVAGFLAAWLTVRFTEPDREVRAYWVGRLGLVVFMGVAMWRLTPFWTRWDIVYYNPLLLFSINPGLPGLFGGLFAAAGVAAFSVWQARKMRPGTRRWPFLVPVAVGAAVFGLGTLVPGALAPPPTPVDRFVLETLVPDLEGKPHALTETKAGLVVVNFWATWCPPCQAEIPELRTYLGTQPKNVRVIGIDALATETGGLTAVLRFVSDQKMAWTQLTDPDGVLQKGFGVTALPTTVVLDGHGRVVARHVGAVDQFWLQSLGTSVGP